MVHSEARGQTGRRKGLQMQVRVVSQRGGEELSFTAAEPVLKPPLGHVCRYAWPAGVGSEAEGRSSPLRPQQPPYERGQRPWVRAAKVSGGLVVPVKLSNFPEAQNLR